MLAGIQAALPDGSKVNTPDGALSKADIVQQLGTALATYTVVDGQKAGLAQAHTLLKAQLPLERVFYLKIKDALIGTLGRTSPLLAQFGLNNKVRKVPTAAKRVVAAAKAAETRKLRGTMSKKQKAALQFAGTVAVATQVTPVAAPSASSRSRGSGIGGAVAVGSGCGTGRAAGARQHAVTQ